MSLCIDVSRDAGQAVIVLRRLTRKRRGNFINWVHEDYIDHFYYGDVLINSTIDREFDELFDCTDWNVVNSVHMQPYTRNQFHVNIELKL